MNLKVTSFKLNQQYFFYRVFVFYFFVSGFLDTTYLLNSILACS